MTEGLRKIPATVLDELGGRVPVQGAALALRRPGMGVRAYVGALQEGGHWPDAVRLLAYGLPKREAVWWACVCCREALGAAPPATATAALTAAEAWVYRPEEETRRAAMRLAEPAGVEQPAFWAAMAAFWSGGSMAPEGAPPVPPGEHLTAHAVAGAVMLAAAAPPADAAAARHRRYLATALDIADGGNGIAALGGSA